MLPQSGRASTVGGTLCRGRVRPCTHPAGGSGSHSRASRGREIVFHTWEKVGLDSGASAGPLCGRQWVMPQVLSVDTHFQPP